MVHLPEALATAAAEAGAAPPRPGGIDTGINPLGTDSDGQTYRNPKASYEVEKKLRSDGSGPRPGGRRDPGVGGKPSGKSTSATDASGASETQRPAPDDQHGDQEIQ